MEKGGRSGILCPVTLPREPHVYVPSCHHDVHLHAGQNKTTIPTSFRRRIYTSPISPLPFPLSSSGDKFVVDVFVPVYTSRNRNSAATRKCLAFLRPVQSPEDVILSPLFRTRNAYRYDTRRAWTPVVIDVFGEEEKCDCNLSFFPDDSPLEELLSHGASRSLPFCLRFAIDLPSFPFDTTYISPLFQLFEKVFNLSVDEREEKKSIDFCNSINETDGSARSDTVERNCHRLCSSFLFRFPSSIVASIHPPFIAVIREPDVSKTFPILFFYSINYRQFRSHRIDYKFIDSFIFPMIHSQNFKQ